MRPERRTGGPQAYVRRIPFGFIGDISRVSVPDAELVILLGLWQEGPGPVAGGIALSLVSLGEITKSRQQVPDPLIFRAKPPLNFLFPLFILRWEADVTIGRKVIE